MLKLGEKGAIPQNDNETYAIAPHIPCGVVTPDLLRKIADISEKYQAKAIKITGATRLAIVGLKESDIDAVWEELGLEKARPSVFVSEVSGHVPAPPSVNWVNRTRWGSEWRWTGNTMPPHCRANSRWRYPAASSAVRNPGSGISD